MTDDHRYADAQRGGTEVIMFMEQQANRPKALVIFGGGSQVSADQAPALARSKADATLVKSFDHAELLATVARLSNGAAWT